jgi:hypothetical protein
MLEIFFRFYNIYQITHIFGCGTTVTEISILKMSFTFQVIKVTEVRQKGFIE